MVSDERKTELEPFAIRVYQQLQAGLPPQDIRRQFDAIPDADPAEVAWVLKDGKARYVGYWEFRQGEEKRYANEFVWIGLAAIALFFIIMYFFGWPEHGRGRGMLTFVLIGGIGSFGYGIWTLMNSPIPTIRDDLDEL